MPPPPHTHTTTTNHHQPPPHPKHIPVLLCAVPPGVIAVVCFGLYGNSTARFEMGMGQVGGTCSPIAARAPAHLFAWRPSTAAVTPPRLMLRSGGRMRRRCRRRSPSAPTRSSSSLRGPPASTSCSGAIAALELVLTRIVGKQLRTLGPGAKCCVAALPASLSIAPKAPQGRRHTGRHRLGDGLLCAPVHRPHRHSWALHCCIQPFVQSAGCRLALFHCWGRGRS